MARLEGVSNPGISMAGIVFYFVRRKLGRVVRPTRIHALNSTLLRGYAAMEGAQESGDSVAGDLKRLAQLRAATLVGCAF